MGVMSKLNVIRMEGKSIARYERRLGLNESKPEPEVVDQQLPLWGGEEESPVFEINRASDLDTMG